MKKSDHRRSRLRWRAGTSSGSIGYRTVIPETPANENRAPTVIRAPNAEYVWILWLIRIPPETDPAEAAREILDNLGDINTDDPIDPFTQRLVDLLRQTAAFPRDRLNFIHHVGQRITARFPKPG